MTCSLCPRGRFNPSWGKDDETACTACATGKYSDSSSRLWDMVLQGLCSGKEQPSEGAASSSACTACPMGLKSGRGQDQCIGMCKPGFYKTTAMAICIHCPRGQFNEQYEAERCTKCEKGKYNNREQQNEASACQNCNAGQYQDQTGSRHCKSCKHGTFSIEGASFFSLCPKGRYSDQNSRKSAKNVKPVQWESTTSWKAKNKLRIVFIAILALTMT